MPRDISVPPKERFNFKYAANTAAAKVVPELPLRLVLAGDWTGQADRRDIRDREPTRLTKKSDFDAALKEHDLRVNISVPDKLSGVDGETLSVALKIESLRDFEPHRIAEMVPELQAKLALRDALSALRANLGDPDLRRKLKAAVADQDIFKQLLDKLSK